MFIKHILMLRFIFGHPAIEYGDQLYHTETRQMALTYMIDFPLYSIPNQGPKWEPVRPLGERADRPAGKEWLHQTVAKEIEQCGEAQSRWDAVWDKALGSGAAGCPGSKSLLSSATADHDRH